jgi:hypothetical protein
MDAHEPPPKPTVVQVVAMRETFPSTLFAKMGKTIRLRRLIMG